MAALMLQFLPSVVFLPALLAMPFCVRRIWPCRTYLPSITFGPYALRRAREELRVDAACSFDAKLRKLEFIVSDFLLNNEKN